MESKKKKLEQLRKHLDILIGALGGLAYAVLTWGIDGYLLQQNNGSVPWLKLAIGTPVVILIFIVAAWFSTRFNNLIIRSLVWMVTATSLSFLISILTFQGTEFAIKALYPNMADQINYILPESIRGRLFVIIVMSNILFLIGGLLIESASEALIKSSGIIGWVLPILFCLIFFGGAGYVADSNFNFQLRDQVLAVNQRINEASQLNPKNLTEREARLIRRFTKLNVALNGPHRLLVGSFDESFSQSAILINFGGTWARCTALNGMVGNCERITN
ncbi:MAG: hypothetical protein Q8N39_11820 [Pelolinea sp.]|nr:hypothetical protein [Pelolinea sp.]